MNFEQNDSYLKEPPEENIQRNQINIKWKLWNSERTGTTRKAIRIFKSIRKITETSSVWPCIDLD